MYVLLNAFFSSQAVREILLSSHEYDVGFALEGSTYVAWSGGKGFGVYLGTQLQKQNGGERRCYDNMKKADCCSKFQQDQILGTYAGIATDKGIDPLYSSDTYTVSVLP